MSASPNGSAMSADLDENPALRPDDRDGLGEAVPSTYPTTISESKSRYSNSTKNAWVFLATDEHIREQWQTLGSRRDLPLYGVPFAMEDNIDAKSFHTTAASPGLTTTHAASDAALVAKLKAQGAILIGKTKMDQTDRDLVISHSPGDSVPNTDPEYVSLGPSSAIVVACGVVPFALGADTDTSGRMPAALNSIYGLRPTRGAISVRNVTPACEALGSISIFTTTVHDAETIMSLVEGLADQDASSGSPPVSIQSTDDLEDFGVAALNGLPSLAVVDQLTWFGNRSHSAAYAAALEETRRLGWYLVPRDFSSLFELGRLLADEACSGERYGGTDEAYKRADRDDEDFTGWDNFTDDDVFSITDTLGGENLCQRLTQEVLLKLKGFHGVLLPTIATSEQVVQDPTQQSSKLGTYTGFVNCLNWCAITFPAGFRQDNLPFGLTLISGQGQEHKLLQITRQWVAGESLLSGATYLTTTTT